MESVTVFDPLVWLGFLGTCKVVSMPCAREVILPLYLRCARIGSQRRDAESRGAQQREKFAV